MKKKQVSILMGIILSILSTGKALAEEVKTFVINKQDLAQIRSKQSGYLKGIEISEDQVLVFEENRNHQIINISIFDDKELSGDYVDGTGSTL